MTMGKRARYGAEAHQDEIGELPNPFPRTIGPNAGKYLQEVVESGLTSGMMGRFEQAFAEEYGVRHCIATPGCTPALAVLAAAFAFDPGDEIIVSPITDYGTVQGLISENYIPVFADTAPGTVNLSADTVEACISDRTRAVLVVHKTGLVCDMDPINELAERHGLVVYEDSCQAVFSEYRGRLAGALSKAGAFSFDSEKTMGSDVGGCLITDDDELAERCRFIGQSRGGEMVPGFGRAHTVCGYAYRMTLSTAAISLAQLEIIRPQVE
ncbi:DegT/DnrJ/EryC1/StrS family aminotransferase, partial [Candidatus Latescibacterota bacterium]